MSRRADLMAITADDLAEFSNRGSVKRATKELETEKVSATIEDKDDGTVVATWSDGPVCTIFADTAPSEWQCSCPSVRFCRHLVRTVLAYQAHGDEPEPARLEPWDPGEIDDETLASCFRKAKLTKLRKAFERQTLVELIRGPKPLVRFFIRGVTLRFSVPGDPRITICDCADTSPCEHVALAVWAFREMAPERESGIVERTSVAPIADEQFSLIEQVGRDFCESGVAGASDHTLSRLDFAARRLSEGGLLWPAAAVEDLAQEIRRYQQGDARFDADNVASHLGELLIRADAISADTGAVPQLFLRGPQATPDAKQKSSGGGRFIGIGCEVRQGRRSARFVAYLQDASMGTVVTIERDFPSRDDPGHEPPPYAQLAKAGVQKGLSLAGLGSGQLLTKGGRRGANHQLTLGRTRAVLNPQPYEWETLRPPVLADNFSEVRAHLATLPPRALRPRWAGMDVFVVPVSAVASFDFSIVDQTIVALLSDANGDDARLEHPFSSRGAPGSEKLLRALRAEGPEPKIRFVSGRFRAEHGVLVLHPIALVFEGPQGREMLQPWVDDLVAGDGNALAESALETPQLNEAKALLRDLHDGFVETLHLGLTRSDPQIAAQWKELMLRAEQTGAHRLLGPIARFAELLEAKHKTNRWNIDAACEAAMELAVLMEIARDRVR